MVYKNDIETESIMSHSCGDLALAPLLIKLL